MNAVVQRMMSRPEFGPFVLLVAMIFVFWQINPAFLSVRNIGNMLAFTVELGADCAGHDSADDGRRI